MNVEQLIKKFHILGIEYEQLNNWAIMYWSHGKMEETDSEPSEFGIINIKTKQILPEKYCGMRLKNSNFLFFAPSYNSDPEINNQTIIMTENTTVNIRGGLVISPVGLNDTLLFGHVKCLNTFQDDDDKFFVMNKQGEYKYFSIKNRIKTDNLPDNWYSFITVMTTVKSRISNNSRRIMLIYKQPEPGLLMDIVAIIEPDLTIK